MKYCVIGCPIGHSLSPIIHKEISRIIGIDLDYTTQLVMPENLENDINNLKNNGFSGFNVTIPHKINIIPYLNSLTDSANLIQSVNTVKIKKGDLIGHSTDGIGFYKDFTRVFGTNFANAKVCILGSGGAARAIIHNILADNPKKVYIVARDVTKAESLRINSACTSCNYDNFRDYLSLCDIVINTTSVGMYPNTEDSLLNKEDFNSNMLVYDLIYNPEETLFLKNAKLQRAATSHGFGMLICQAIAAQEFWQNINLEKATNEIYEACVGVFNGKKS